MKFTESEIIKIKLLRWKDTDYSQIAKLMNISLYYITTFCKQNDIHPIPVPDGFVRCTKCKQIKLPDHFGKNKKQSSGFSSRCKECLSYCNTREYNSRYRKNRWQNDLKFRLDICMRNRIEYSLKHGKNGRGWEILVGYTLDDLMHHLEKQFTIGMTWGNHGNWHIDHIIPISRFNYDDPTDIDFKRCWALENLQPLWAEENKRKNNRLKEAFQPYLKLNYK